MAPQPRHGRVGAPRAVGAGVVVLLAGLAGLTGCSDAGGPLENTFALCTDLVDNDKNGSIDCADPNCTATGEKAIVDYCAKQNGTGIDGFGKDVKKGDAVDGGSDPDGLPVADTNTPTAVEAKMCVVPNGFGCPCTVASDCDSGYCINGDQGKVCTQTCAENCPKDWKCIQPSGGDAVWICVPAYPDLCKPCAEHGDCQKNGLNDNYCVPFYKGDGFIDGSFCMTACTQVMDNVTKLPVDTCKDGYICQTLKLNVEGKPVKQCVPKTAECGCQDAWAQAGLWTECSKTNADGKCVSKRRCGFDATTNQTFLSACDAPGPATEVCGDGKDNDCNGKTDEDGAAGSSKWYLDNDSDGFGTGQGKSLCNDPGIGYSAVGGDCNDFNTAIHPGKEAVEICNSIDDNCNGNIDETGAEGCKLYYADQDSDTFGVTNTGQCLCAASTSHPAGQPGDCDDTPGSGGGINPGVPEICDGVDNDCNGKTDDGSADSTCGVLAGGKAKCIDGSCGVGSCQKGFYDVNGDPSDGCECASSAPAGGLGGFCGAPIDLGELPDGTASISKGGQILPGESGDWYKFNATDSPDIGLTGNCDAYDVKISFVLNPGSIFVFDVYRGSCGSGNQVCSGETQHNWSTSFYGIEPFGPGNKASPSGQGTTNPSPVPEAAGECQCVPSAPPGGVEFPICVKDNGPKGGGGVKNCGPHGLPGMNVCANNSAVYFVRVYTKPNTQLTCEGYIIKFDNAGRGTPPPQQ